MGTFTGSKRDFAKMLGDIREDAPHFLKWVREKNYAGVFADTQNPVLLRRMSELALANGLNPVQIDTPAREALSFQKTQDTPEQYRNLPWKRIVLKL